MFKKQQKEDNEKKREIRIMPQTELDLNLMMTDPVWGKSEVSEELRNKLKKQFLYLDKEGNQRILEEGLWDLLGFYTRDMRLGNLSKWDGELEFVAYHLDLAHDFLQEKMIQPFLIALSRAATRLELSQSVGGFLRRRMHTFSQEHFSGELEPPKKSIFGMQQKK